MNRMIRRLALGTMLLAPLLAPAGAQVNRNYDVKTMNFDLWCQEEAGLPPDRCDKRSPQDEATFEAYRAKIERYEVPYLQQKDKDAGLSHDLLHNDPVDAPLDQNPSNEQRNPPPRTPPP